MSKRILVACEESQAVCIAFRERGFEAYSCDIQECSGGHPEWHIKGDVLQILDQEWDLMVAHPPCTYLCNGGLNWLNRRPEWREEQEKSRIFFMQLAEAPISFIAIENPAGRMNTLYRRPDQIVRAFQFGEPFKKDICFWLKGLPVLEHDESNHFKGQLRTFDPGNGKMTNAERRRVKSKTFPGIAAAMADQWGQFLLKNDA